MKTLKEISSWMGSFGIAFAFALLIGVFVFQPYKVEGHSMDPTLHDQERIYVSKISRTFSYLPNYGDIVIIDSRVDRKRLLKDDLLDNPILQRLSGEADNHIIYVKRVIGKPGDVLEFKNHQVYRNGEPLEEPYINGVMNFVADGKRVVPENHIFVMGDNRNNSRDSRDIGFIPLDHVLGKKVFD